MADILYGEASGLLALPLQKKLSHYSFSIVKENNEFIKMIYKEAPSLIILGDSFTSTPEELLFTVKNIPVIKEIPIIYLGDTEEGSILPASLFLARNEQILDKKLNDINNLLDRSLKNNLGRKIEALEIPKNTDLENYIYSESRIPVMQNIYRNWFKDELSGINLTTGNTEQLLGSIAEKLIKLLFVDFCRIDFKSSDENINKLVLVSGIQEDLYDPINRFCQLSIQSSKSEKPSADNSELSALINQSYQLENEGTRFHIVAGCRKKSPIVLPENMAKEIGSLVSNLISLNIQYNKSQNETETLYRAFSHFLPGTIIDDLILKDSEKELMTGEKREIVVLFSHIRSFDYIMEHNKPQTVVDFLNNHFSNVVDIIQWHGGTIDKFIGDAVFAIFGAPVSYTDNAERAAQAALDMIDQYSSIDTGHLKLPDGGFAIGIGLNEGDAIIGNIGCSDKFDYTAIGDTVNLAARLESLTKHYLCPILVSEKVKKKLDRTRFTRLVDTAKVKGKTEPSPIYSLEIEPERFSEEWQSVYYKGLKMYNIGNWLTAGKYFEKALIQIPDDFPTTQFLERCANFIENPPEDWNGAVTLDFK